MSERRPKSDEVKYQVYIDERKALVEGEQAGANNFGKNILTLAAGALGISLVFLEKIAPEPNPETLTLLYIAWASLVLSLLATLSSLLTGQHAFRRARDILENEFFPEEKNEKQKNGNCWAISTQFLNWISIFAFILGAGMLALFSIQNVKSGMIDKKIKPAISVTTGTSDEQQTTK